MQRIRKKDKAILKQAANLYRNHLENRNLMYITLGDDFKYHAYPITFRSSHFMHLTGIKSMDKPFYFFQKCLDEDLDEKKYIYTSFTITKIQHLLSAIRMLEAPGYIARFNQMSHTLKTDMLIGDDEKCLGLLKTLDGYLPNTLLITDIRKHNQVDKVVGVFKKSDRSSLYKQLDLIDELFDYMDLDDELKTKIDMDHLYIKPLYSEYDLVNEYMRLPRNIYNHLDDLARMKKVSIQLEKQNKTLEEINEFIEKCTDLMMWDNADSHPLDFYIDNLLNAIEARRIMFTDVLYSSNSDILDCIYDDDYSKIHINYYSYDYEY